MKEIIAWTILGVAAIGATYCIVLIIGFLITPKDAYDDLSCNCKDCIK